MKYAIRRSVFYCKVQIHRHLDCMRIKYGTEKCVMRFPKKPHIHGPSCTEHCAKAERTQDEVNVSAYIRRDKFIWNASVNWQITERGRGD